MSENNVHIYCSSTGTAIPDSFEHEYLAMLPPQMRAAIVRYKLRKDRQATLFGKLLLLRALRMRYHETALQKLHSLQETEHGKPFIPGEPEFNISHSGDLVVLAIAQRGAIGIDIEKISAVNIEDFSRYVPEVASLHEHYDEDQVNNLFFDCWTRKEAVLKGCGKGLSAPLEHVSLKESTALLYGTTWFLEKLPVEDRYCCHIATDQPLEHVVIDRVNLMNGWA